MNLLLFVVLPYVSMALAIIGTIYRYRTHPLTFSSLSSQTIEREKHFWAVVPLHYGMIGVLAGHLVGLLLPSQVLAWNAVPARLYIVEATGMAFALLAFAGLVLAVRRRITTPNLLRVTSPGDWVLLFVLLVQVGGGLAIALTQTWGSYWYQATAVPYLISVFTFRPDAGLVAAMPWNVKLHYAGAWVILLLLPFTRLVHMLAVPLGYLSRRPLVVRWRVP